MQLSESHDVLILGGEPEDWQLLESLQCQLQCAVAIAQSEDHAMSWVKQTMPCLVILAGSYLDWSSSFVENLRCTAPHRKMTIVALTDFQAPSWLYQEENPGFDGFLVKPLSQDIMLSLVQSARARQQAYSTVR